MFSIDLKKITKISAIFIILGAVIFGYFCLDTFTHHQMETGLTGNTSSVMQNAESCCSTTFSKYSESLLSNFNLSSRADDYLLILIISVVLAYIINSLLRSITNTGSLLQRLFLLQNPNLVAFNSLKLAFSNGIINPKIF